MIKYRIGKGDGTWLDLSPIVDSRETVIKHNLCSTDAKSVVDEASFTCRPVSSQMALRQTLITYLLEAAAGEYTLYSDILDDDEYLFRGIVDVSKITIQSKHVAGNITISIEDMSALHLDDKVDSYVFLEQRTITQIVQYLIELAGYERTSTSLDPVDEVVLDAFVIDRENADTYRDYIDLLLYEAGGYVLDCDNEGKLNIRKLPFTSYTPTRTIDDYLVAEGVKSETELLEYDGLELKWSTLKESDKDQIVYVEGISVSINDENQLKGEEIPADGYFPEDGDITATYQEYSSDLLDRAYMTEMSRKKNEDLTIIAVRDVEATIVVRDSNGNQIDPDDAFDYPVITDIGMTTNPTIYPTKAWFLLHNKYRKPVDLQNFQLTGRVLYRDKLNTILTPSNAKNAEEYESTYIYSIAQAERFSQTYWHFRRYARTVHEWSELGLASYGDVVKIIHKGMDTAQAALIVKVEYSLAARGQWKTSCTAISLGPYDEYEYKAWGSSGSVKPDVEDGKDGEPGKDAPLTRIEYRWGESDKEPPISGGVFFWRGKAMFFTQKILGDFDDYRDWMRDPPDKPTTGVWYLWIRISVDDGKTWSYSLFSQNPVIDFTIKSPDIVYTLSNRGTVVEEQRLEYSIVRQNIVGDCEFTCSIYNYEEGAENPFVSVEQVGDNFYVTLHKGCVNQSFVVTATIKELGDDGVRSLQVTGVREQKEVHEYLNIIDGTTFEDPEDALEDVTHTSNNEPLNDGDYLLLKRYSTENPGAIILVPYRYNGSKWVEAQYGVDSNWGEIANGVMNDIYANSSVMESGSFAWLVVQNSMTNNAYVRNLAAQDIGLIVDTKNNKFGAIHSQGYQKGFYDSGTSQKGFWVDAEGDAEFQQIKVKGMTAIDADITGSLTADALQTVNSISDITVNDIKNDYKENWIKTDSLQLPSSNDEITKTDEDPIFTDGSTEHDVEFYVIQGGGGNIMAAGRNGVLKCGRIQNGVIDWDTYTNVGNKMGGNWLNLQVTSILYLVDKWWLFGWVDHGSETSRYIVWAENDGENIKFNKTWFNSARSTYYGWMAAAKYSEDLVVAVGRTGRVAYKLFMLRLSSSGVSIEAESEQDMIPTIFEDQIDMSDCASISVAKGVIFFSITARENLVWNTSFRICTYDEDTKTFSTFATTSDSRYSCVDDHGKNFIEQGAYILTAGDTIKKIEISPEGTLSVAQEIENTYSVNILHYSEKANLLLGVNSSGYYPIRGFNPATLALTYTSAITISGMDTCTALYDGFMFLGVGYPVKTFAFSLFTYKRIYDTFRSIIPMIETQSKIPLSEPFADLASVSGTFTTTTGTKNLTRMQVANGKVVLWDNLNVVYEYSTQNQPTFNLTIYNLQINETAPSLQVGNIYPQNSDVTITIGSQEKRFEGWFDDLFGNAVYGAVFN